MRLSASLGVGLSDYRDERRNPIDRPGGGDQRFPSQRDRDRILNTTAFRRLAGVTQVVATAEGEVFHNRLTHSLEVAQIGRRIAEHLALREEAKAVALGGLDPETVEAACLAHDLGHPPFGHVAEDELDQIIDHELRVADGFEGNPQSFRIVTRLSARHITLQGLNLTRATLNAMLKYPWNRDKGVDERRRKWGAYAADQESMAWVRDAELDQRKCLEAELMDWADDIAYAVHDAEDFYRAGLVPFDRLHQRTRSEVRDTTGKVTHVEVVTAEIDAFVDFVLAKWKGDTTAGRKRTYLREDAVTQLRRIFALAPGEPYDGTYSQRSSLRTWTSSLIGEYVRAIHIVGSPVVDTPRVTIDADAQMQVDLLKELMWYYVIQSPALAGQQFGHRRVVRELFGVFHQAARAPDDAWVRRVLPNRFADVLRNQEAAGPVFSLERLRLAADSVAALTEQQALDLHHRLTGHDARSVLDPIVR